MKSAKYFRLDPQFQALFEAHVATHQQKLAAAAAAQQAQQAAMTTAPQQIQGNQNLDELKMKAYFDTMTADRQAQWKLRELDQQQRMHHVPGG